MSLSQSVSFGRTRRRGILASTAVAAMATLLISSAALAGGVSTRILRIAPTGVQIDTTHIAVANHHVAVTWQEDGSDKYSFVRWSADGGQTWAPRVSLDHGLPSQTAGVDVCGGYVWAISSFPGAGGGLSLGLDSRQVDGPGYGWGYFDQDPSADGNVMTAAIACVGGRRLAAVWTDVSTNPTHLKLAIRPLWPCVSGCDPHTSYLYDLGPSDHDAAPDVVATKDSIYAVWEYNGHMYFKRLSVADDADATVTPHPTRALPEGTSGGDWAGAYGSRVVIAYEAAPHSSGETRVIVSTDGGRSFGSPVGLAGSHLPEPDVAVHGREIVVEGYLTYRYHSIDGGGTWSREPSHAKGQQLGAFIDVAGTLMLAEAWDNDRSGATQQKLRFSVGPP